jgi:hypothetical protein
MAVLLSRWVRNLHSGARRDVGKRVPDSRLSIRSVECAVLRIEPGKAADASCFSHRCDDARLNVRIEFETGVAKRSTRGSGQDY